MRYDIRFSGSGGQGIITAGILLAQAAAIKIPAVIIPCPPSLLFLTGMPEQL